LAGEPEGKGPLVRHKYRWEDNIKLDFKETGCKDVECIHLASERVQWQTQ